jgi:Flp pilus assembly pilin Flp
MLHPIVRLLVALQVALAPRDERGQSMAEYALLILGVGLLAVFVFKWFQGSGLMENLFGAVVKAILPG